MGVREGELAGIQRAIGTTDTLLIKTIDIYHTGGECASPSAALIRCGIILASIQRRPLRKQRTRREHEEETHAYIIHRQTGGVDVRAMPPAMAIPRDFSRWHRGSTARTHNNTPTRTHKKQTHTRAHTRHSYKAHTQTPPRHA